MFKVSWEQLIDAFVLWNRGKELIQHFLKDKENLDSWHLKQLLALN